MLYLDGRQRLSEFVLRCPDLSRWIKNLQPIVGKIENIFGKIFVMFLQVIT